ncbi:MAG TPA: tetratricopeptide repeat protein, partial [Blastocatellia bacterium]|nr:tetratricopeptide repeat protein [Blastocatellia bacterium]
MVIDRIRGFFFAQKKKREQQERAEEEAENFRQSEEMRQAESLKKEADRLAQLKQYKTAIEEYRKSLELFPYKGTEENLFKSAKEFLFKVHFNIAACYSYLDQFDDAIKAFDEAIKIDVEHADNKVKALMAKGSSYYRKKLFLQGDARSVYHIDVELEQGAKKEKKDDKTDYVSLAHKCFMEATELDRTNADAWYSRGHMEFLMNKIKDAVNSFDNVLNLRKTFENKENIPLFNEIKREKGIALKPSELIEEKMLERTFKTKSGHYVGSKAEQTIADFLFDHGMLFQYDVAVTWADNENFRSTFYLPKLDLYVDHFVTADLKQAPKVIKSRVKQYEKHKKHHLYTTSDDEKHMHDVLRLKLK